MNPIQFTTILNPESLKILKEEIASETKSQILQALCPMETIVYLSSKEVCDLLKIDLSTLYKWRKESKIPSYGIGNRVFFKRHEIDQIINKNRLS